jgi:phosphoribosylformylglycinamidine synthase
MWQFAEAVEGLAEACRALGTPVTGGNVSFYNETLGEAVLPTPTVGMVGLLEDVSLHLTAWFKRQGDLIALLGETREELGGSEYLRLIRGLKRGLPPRVDLQLERRIHETCLEAIGAGLLSSAHDCSEGGLAVALAESCVGGPGRPLGAEAALGTDMRPDALFFGETQGRILISFHGDDRENLERIAIARGVPLSVIGKVGGVQLRLTAGSARADLALGTLNSAWRDTFRAHFKK